MHPKVFLSHASEDKGRFVLDFARQLRENGVDVWLDQWEMKPGDSLVDKIFDEGLKDASAVRAIRFRIAQSGIGRPASNLPLFRGSTANDPKFI
jgi:hypothetical protein